MNWPRQCAIIIPCHNEEAAIANVVASARGILPSIFVIDDGSSDQTAARASEAGAKIISLPTPRGKGTALREGFKAATAANFSWALTMDGDCQHDSHEIERFLRAADEGYDLIIGNRMHSAHAMTVLRRAANRWMSARISRRLGFDCPDSQCGFRLVSLEALRRIELASDNFEIESEMLVKFARAGLRVGFVPVSVKASGRPSRIRIARDTVRWFKWWFRAG